jgi:hypothetical protein
MDPRRTKKLYFGQSTTRLWPMQCGEYAPTTVFHIQGYSYPILNIIDWIIVIVFIADLLA